MLEVERASAKRFAIFNHKGGVGKTTLTVNIGNALSQLGKRVLLVDADPQCNLTSYLVDADVVDDLLDNSDGPKGATIWSALKPVVEGTGDFKSVKPIELPNGCYLLPGDIRLSDFEGELNDYWNQALQRKTRGYKGTSGVSAVVNKLCKDNNIEYVFYDCGPNIGPLNRTILLDCDYFIVTAACDLFSVRALKTLGRTLTSWIENWRTISGLAPESTYLLPGRPRFLGYIPQRFRIYGQAVASQDARYMADLHRRVHSEISSVLKKVDKSLGPPPNKDVKLGEVRDFHSLVSISQRQSRPLAQVSGPNTSLRPEAERTFAALAKAILSRVSSES